MKRSIAMFLMTALLIPMLALSINAKSNEDVDDADVPKIGRRKIAKRDYMRLREEHVNKLRGMVSQRDKQKQSRARALRSWNSRKNSSR